ncbi:PAS domain-containing protein [Roseisolibacter sp. H3M3-2]|uniref:sensor histidine kinase n=1 Tax=Roseisolibacter sp. H3M3-2 TaxID=3031323 RepID=UPI0023DA106D|nr:PAS domain-containing protein [Roseisolibacter sp. H3M3-2]MDF1503861.1 PAS domain-containing protein [Roseisolibacter sp. H3M3-2]
MSHAPRPDRPADAPPDSVPGGASFTVEAAESGERLRAFRAAAEGAPVMLGLTDGRGRCVYCNAAWYAFTGQSEERALGVGWLDAVHPDDRADVERAYREAHPRREPFRVECRLRRRDGAPRWAIGIGVPRFGEAGDLLGFLGAFVDVHERHEAERRLRASYGELEAVYRAVPVGLCVFDRDLRWVRINEWLAQLNGVPAQAHVGRRPSEVLGALGVEAEAMLARVLETGEAVRDVVLEGETPADPGVRHTWIEQWLPIHAEDGTVLGISVVAEDVTERQRSAAERERLHEAERAARARAEANERRLAQLQRVTAVLSGAASTGEVARAVLEVGRDTFGADAATMVEVVEDDAGAAGLRTVGSLGFVEEPRARWDARPLDPSSPIAQAIRERRVVSYATAAERAAAWSAAAPPDVEAAVFVPLLLEGRAVGGWALAFGRTRTFGDDEREFLLTLGRQAAQALERARLFEAERAARRRAETLQGVTAALVRLRTLEEIGAFASRELCGVLGARMCWVTRLSDDGAWLETVGVHGVPEETARRWRRFSLAEAVPIADAVREGAPQWWPDLAALQAAYPHYAESASAIQREGTATLPLFVGEGADARPVGAISLGFGAPQRFDADARGFLLALAQQCAQAIERARLADAAARSLASAEHERARAEEASLAKSGFLATMSHELRTPLNAIAGHVELMEMELHGPVTPAQREALGRVQRAGRLLLSRINDVLNFARLESGHVAFDVRPTPIAEVVREVLPLVEPQLASRGLLLDVEVDGEATAHADREKLGQVLLNLLSNALKFTPRGRVALRLAADATHVRVTVQDSGIGIPAAQRERVFEPFVQVRSGLTREHEGTGLGLAISRDLARGMGGDLTVESEEGKGSTFTVTLGRAEYPED